MEPDASTSAAGNAPPPSGLRPLLHKTSRTFALSIPLLPEPLQTEVAVAYLLFRIIDTFEDAVRWAPGRRAKALGLFAQQMKGDDPSGLQELTSQWMPSNVLAPPSMYFQTARPGLTQSVCRPLGNSLGQGAGTG